MKYTKGQTLYWSHRTSKGTLKVSTVKVTKVTRTWVHLNDGSTFAQGYGGSYFATRKEALALHARYDLVRAVLEGLRVFQRYGYADLNALRDDELTALSKIVEDTHQKCFPKGGFEVGSLTKVYGEVFRISRCTNGKGIPVKNGTRFKIRGFVFGDQGLVLKILFKGKDAYVPSYSCNLA